MNNIQFDHLIKYISALLYQFKLGLKLTSFLYIKKAATHHCSYQQINYNFTRIQTVVNLLVTVFWLGWLVFEWRLWVRQKPESILEQDCLGRSFHLPKFYYLEKYMLCEMTKKNDCYFKVNLLILIVKKIKLFEFHRSELEFGRFTFSLKFLI